ncbi:MAG TPA: hypothetical protein DEP45_03155, partial [Armatimonadetes bacterium]|nr:hypothetical protein [Armatimonadota bacterium]
MRLHRESLKALIAGVCGCAAASLPDDARLGEPPEWDSLAHLALMVAIGDAFGREIGPAQMARLTSLPALEEWLAAGQPSSEASAA